MCSWFIVVVCIASICKLYTYFTIKVHENIIVVLQYWYTSIYNMVCFIRDLQTCLNGLKTHNLNHVQYFM